MPGTELTVVEVLADLAARGFVGDFHTGGPPPALICGACAHRIDPAEAEVVELHRFEGASDPADEAVVVAIRCHVCRALGTLVAGYGPSADGVEGDVLVALVDRRPDREGGS